MRERVGRGSGEISIGGRKEKTVNSIGSGGVPNFSEYVRFIMERRISVLLFTTRAEIEVFAGKAIIPDSRDGIFTIIAGCRVQIVLIVSFPLLASKFSGCRERERGRDGNDRRGRGRDRKGSRGRDGNGRRGRGRGRDGKGSRRRDGNGRRAIWLIFSIVQDLVSSHYSNKL